VIVYKSGDLLDAPEPIIAHSVNAQNKFGAGLAKQIADRYPDVKTDYLKYGIDPGWSPGDIQYCWIDNKWIANCCTQEHYGRYRDYNDYNAFYKIFIELCCFCERHGYKSISIPKMGCGLGGGDWGKVEKILRHCIVHKPIDFHVYTP
jgi:O-acetyl-ADP-ribose deacetylase (regulator of RNase III)